MMKDPMLCRAITQRARLITLPCHCQRRFAGKHTQVAAGDHVLLKSSDETKPPVFIPRLRVGTVKHTRWGDISHNSIIGKHSRDVVSSKKGQVLRVLVPTLEEYVSLTPRLVTPVYPADASLIVSLLDTHVSPSPPSEPPSTPMLEILEAGTGHGALTLYLSRAISAGNPPLSASLLDELRLDEKPSSSPNTVLLEPRPDPSPELQTFLSTRRAVLHTLDISPAHSHQARKIVRNFRRGIYAGNVDFHIGDVKSWLEEQKSQRTEAEQKFLSHVLLDLPNAPAVLGLAAEALRDDGVIVVFNPSVSQIQKCVEMVREHRLPLLMERVLELGAGWTGGREWDVRTVRPRRNDIKTSEEDSEAESEATTYVAGEECVDTKEKEDEWVMVSRPKVGARVVGGGFLGVWRRMTRRNADNP